MKQILKKKYNFNNSLFKTALLRIPSRNNAHIHAFPEILPKKRNKYMKRNEFTSGNQIKINHII